MRYIITVTTIKRSVDTQLTEHLYMMMTLEISLLCHNVQCIAIQLQITNFYFDYGERVAIVIDVAPSRQYAYIFYPKFQILMMPHNYVHGRIVQYICMLYFNSSFYFLWVPIVYSCWECCCNWYKKTLWSDKDVQVVFVIGNVQ